MYSDIVKIIPLPEHIKVYAEYKDVDDDIKGGFSRIYFIGLVKEGGDPLYNWYFIDVDSEGIFQLADDCTNFVQFHIQDSWLRNLPDDFYKKEDLNDGKTNNDKDQ